MTAHRRRLRRLLSPRAIAVVGGRRATLAIEQSERLGFDGPMWLVNPTTESLNGRPTYASLDSLPQTPDAVFIAVAADTTIDVVAEAAELGVAGCVAYASGFAERERADRTAALVEAAGDMPVIGPNCHGFINAVTGAALWPEVSGCERVKRGVAVVSQSGNIAINLTMQQRATPISHVITLGNQVTVDVADCVAVLAESGVVDAIALYVEQVSDSIAFGDAARLAHERRVPIVALPAGTSDTGETLVQSHTSSLAGPAAAQAALFARYGVTTVATPGELLDALSVLAVGGRLSGPSMVSMSSSGGEAALVADLATSLPIELPAFGDEIAARLDGVLGGRVSVANPLDYHTYIWGDRERMAQCFELAIGAADVGVLVLDWPGPGIDDADWWPTLEAFCDAVDASGVRGVLTTSVADALPRAVAEHLAKHQIAAVPGIANALTAIVAAGPVGPVGEQHIPAPAVVARTAVDEAEGKELLRSTGLPVPRGRTVGRSELGDAVEAIGFPAVLKALGPVHASDVGGVALGLETKDEVVAAAHAMRGVTDRFLVEREVEDVVGELLIGVSVDDPIGWTVTIGAGGVLTELIADTATLLLPVHRRDIEGALEGLRISRVLGGYRGGPAGDVVAAVDAVVALAELATARNVEIEVNPLLVCGQGVWIADALMSRIEAAHE